jgi:hypothetical protein
METFPKIQALVNSISKEIPTHAHIFSAFIRNLLFDMDLVDMSMIILSRLNFYTKMICKNNTE